MESSRESLEILSLFENGNSQKASKLLYKKLFPLVKRNILNKGGSNDDAFDVFQDAMLNAYKMIKNKEYDTKYNLLGFIYNLSINRWLNKLKRDETILYTNELKEELDVISQDKIEITYKTPDTREQDLIKIVFQSIGNKCKELLTYTIFKDLTMEDIMERMEMNSVAAVKMQHKRCKEKLVQYIHSNPQLIEILRNSIS